jgi:hypothetical protein
VNEEMPVKEEASSPSYSMSIRDAITSSGTAATVTESGSSA